MPPDEHLSALQPPQEVLALGTPERVVALSQHYGPSDRFIGRLATDPTFAAGAGMAGAAVVLAVLTGVVVALSAAPPDAMLLLLLGFEAVLFAVGVYLLRGRPRLDVNRVHAAYVFYPEALAYLHQGRWAVARWADVAECHADGPTGLLVTRDGTRLTLERGGLLPARDVLWEVEARAHGMVPAGAPARPGRSAADRLRRRLAVFGIPVAAGVWCVLTGKDYILVRANVRVDTLGYTMLGLAAVLFVLDRLGVDFLRDGSLD